MIRIPWPYEKEMPLVGSSLDTEALGRVEIIETHRSSKPVFSDTVKGPIIIGMMPCESYIIVTLPSQEFA